MSSLATHGNPVPQGTYISAKRHCGLVFTSGMTPRADGNLLFHGLVRIDEPIESYRDAVVLACSNALVAARSTLIADEALTAVVSLTVYVAAEDGFNAHSRIADFASQFLEAELGAAGIGSRCAIGVSALPGNAPIEIQLIAAICS